MNEKILVELKVPELNSTYNVYLPINLKIGEVISLLNKGLFDLSGQYYNNNDSLLYSDDGDKMVFNHFIYETNLKNGSTIILL